MVDGEKQCIKCSKVKSLAEFYKHSKMKDGHFNKCIDCAKVDSANHRQLNSEYCKQYDSFRNKSRKKKSVDIERKSRKKWQASNQMAVKCHKAVAKAVKSRVLIKPDICSKCKVYVDKSKIHAHHEDYSRPLDVVWLCYKCHADHHGRDVSEFTPRRKT